MKKEDLKNSIDNIKISDEERERILNNILINNKEKKHSFAPLFATLSIACIAGVVGVSLNWNSITYQFKKPNNTIDNVKLASQYKEKVVLNIGNYMEANSALLDEIEDNGSFSLDTSKIVNDDEFKTCEGKITINNYKGNYLYSTDVSCGGEKNKEKEYTLFDGSVISVLTVGEKTLISASVEEGINFILLNEYGKVDFTYLLEIENSNIKKIISANETKDNYIILYEDPSDLNVENTSNIANTLILNKKGERVYKNEDMLQLNMVHFSKYLNNDGNTIYLYSDFWRNPYDEVPTNYKKQFIERINLDKLTEVGFGIHLKEPNITESQILGVKNSIVYYIKQQDDGWYIKAVKLDSHAYDEKLGYKVLSFDDVSSVKFTDNLQFPEDIKSVITEDAIYVTNSYDKDDKPFIKKYDLNLELQNEATLEDHHTYGNLSIHDGYLVAESIEVYDDTETTSQNSVSYIKYNLDLEILETNPIDYFGENVDKGFNVQHLEAYSINKNTKVFVYNIIDENTNKSKLLIVNELNK